MLKIAQHTIAHGLVLAPLAGISDAVFRSLCKSCGAEFVFSEMVSAEGVRRRMKRTLSYLEFGEEERPIALQIFGYDVESLCGAARVLERDYHPDVIDINLGCPVRKVTKTGAGAAMLKDSKRLSQTISSICRVVKTPVSAKMRIGWDCNQACELARMLEESGVCFLTVHARNAKEGYDTKAHWDVFASLCKNISIPIIANGDIRTPEDAGFLLNEIGVSAVMIGRGAIGRPWIFRHMQEYLTGGTYPAPPSFRKRLHFLITQMDLMEKRWGASRVTGRIKKQIPYYLKGMRAARQHVHALLSMDSFDGMRAEVVKIAASMAEE